MIFDGFHLFSLQKRIILFTINPRITNKGAFTLSESEKVPSSLLPINVNYTLNFLTASQKTTSRSH